MLMYLELNLVWFGKAVVTSKMNSLDIVMLLHCQNLLSLNVDIDSITINECTSLYLVDG